MKNEGTYVYIKVHGTVHKTKSNSIFKSLIKSLSSTIILIAYMKSICWISFFFSFNVDSFLTFSQDLFTTVKRNSLGFLKCFVLEYHRIVNAIQCCKMTYYFHMHMVTGLVPERYSSLVHIILESRSPPIGIRFMSTVVCFSIVTIFHPSLKLYIL